MIQQEAMCSIGRKYYNGEKLTASRRQADLLSRLKKLRNSRLTLGK
jgi:hypothetical protein